MSCSATSCVDDRSDTSRFLDRYAEFVAELYCHTDNLSEYIQKSVYEDDNVYVRLVAEGKTIRPAVAETLQSELRTLEILSCLTPADLKGDYSGYLPSWQTAKIDLVGGYAEPATEFLQPIMSLSSKTRSSPP